MPFLCRDRRHLSSAIAGRPWRAYRASDRATSFLRHRTCVEKCRRGRGHARGNEARRAVSRASMAGHGTYNLRRPQTFLRHILLAASRCSNRLLSMLLLNRIILSGTYACGDGAAYDTAKNHWQIIGRLDDVINVSGHRLGTAEIEDVLVREMQNHLHSLLSGRTRGCGRVGGGLTRARRQRRDCLRICHAQTTT